MKTRFPVKYDNVYADIEALTHDLDKLKYDLNMNQNVPRRRPSIIPNATASPEPASPEPASPEPASPEPASPEPAEAHEPEAQEPASPEPAEAHKPVHSINSVSSIASGISNILGDPKTSNMIKSAINSFNKSFSNTSIPTNLSINTDSEDNLSPISSPSAKDTTYPISPTSSQSSTKKNKKNKNKTNASPTSSTKDLRELCKDPNYKRLHPQECADLKIKSDARDAKKQSKNPQNINQGNTSPKAQNINQVNPLPVPSKKQSKTPQASPQQQNNKQGNTPPTSPKKQGKKAQASPQQQNNKQGNTPPTSPKKQGKNPQASPQQQNNKQGNTSPASPKKQGKKAQASASTKEKYYLIDSEDEYYMKKYRKYKQKYLELKQLLNL